MSSFVNFGGFDSSPRNYLARKQERERQARQVGQDIGSIGAGFLELKKDAFNREQLAKIEADRQRAKDLFNKGGEFKFDKEATLEKLRQARRDAQANIPGMSSPLVEQSMEITDEQKLTDLETMPRSLDSFSTQKIQTGQLGDSIIREENDLYDMSVGKQSVEPTPSHQLDIDPTLGQQSIEITDEEIREAKQKQLQEQYGDTSLTLDQFDTLKQTWRPNMSRAEELYLESKQTRPYDPKRADELEKYSYDLAREERKYEHDKELIFEQANVKYKLQELRNAGKEGEADSFTTAWNSFTSAKADYQKAQRDYSDGIIDYNKLTQKYIAANAAKSVGMDFELSPGDMKLKDPAEIAVAKDKRNIEVDSQIEKATKFANDYIDKRASTIKPFLGKTIELNKTLNIVANKIGKMKKLIAEGKEEVPASEMFIGGKALNSAMESGLATGTDELRGIMGEGAAAQSIQYVAESMDAIKAVMKNLDISGDEKTEANKKVSTKEVLRILEEANEVGAVARRSYSAGITDFRGDIINTITDDLNNTYSNSIPEKNRTTLTSSLDKRLDSAFGYKDPAKTIKEGDIQVIDGIKRIATKLPNGKIVWNLVEQKGGENDE
jgi:hypothetical protein